ncbi:exopolyphosphatase [Thalassotalea euphylliae]|uniref:Exopolyphosphatase n=1 Tax=Thalassotalea euphylliae TaxID=1655234 RepID=A0A3E0TVC2_9GAMM|nr:exopolyphosphatase [Thalassotalea euphylliae]REL27882.1 exopolyphosphatase [Thalassotalea euphylliae]
MTQSLKQISESISDIKSSNGSYHIGALDIGSNSFHFVFARVVNDNLQILHSEKYRVRLAQGLDDQNLLDHAAIERGVKALADLAPLTEKLSPDNFRVVATFTLRQAKNAQAFLDAAAKVFPFDIEVVSGHEEARLIYQGVAHYLPPATQRLIIDIGGGSTECVIGKDLQTSQLTSLNIGCVSFARLYFANGHITKQAFKRAILHAKQEIESHVNRFKAAGWHEAVGTSGTLKTIFQQLNLHREANQPFNLAELRGFKDQLINFGHADNIQLPNLKESRRHIIAPGVAILIGIAELLEINSIDYCDYSLREGVLSEQLEAIQFDDIRDRTINSLSTRFNVDAQQVNKVKTLATRIYQATEKAWQLNKKAYKQLLNWAIWVHEIGYDINPSGYHKHSRYILLNADLAGFNVEQQQALAWLVGNQRKKIQFEDQQLWYLLNEASLAKLLVILRLSILLSQQRQLTEHAEISISADKDSINLTFPSNWLGEKPLVEADLTQEQKQLSVLGIALSFN